MTARNRDNLHGLGKMILLRLITIVISTIVVSFIIFWLADFSPFDPLAHYLGANYGDYTEAERAKIATALGIDTPWWQQWLTWWKDVLSGNLGWSRVYSKPVGTVISERLPWTLLLSAAGLALTMVFSLGEQSQMPGEKPLRASPFLSDREESWRNPKNCPQTIPEPPSSGCSSSPPSLFCSSPRALSCPSWGSGGC